MERLPGTKRMAGSNGVLSQRVQSLDWLFCQIGQPGSDRNTLPTPSLFDNIPASLPSPAARADEMPADWPRLPATLHQSAEGRAAYEWLRAERQRLEEYTRAQYAVIRQNHQAVMSRNFQNEEELARRSQKLNGDAELLATQAKSLQERADRLAQQEAVAAAQMSALAKTQEELRSLEQARDALRVEVASQRAVLAELQAQAARMEQGLLATDLNERQRAQEEKQAELTDRQAQMEQRYQALERAEAAASRRTAELDEMEFRLGKEFEKQERQLALERREIEAQRVRLELPG
jgi:hypothetical protein